MPYEDAAPLFATGVRVCVIVYYYDEVEKQILPAFGHTLRRATALEAKAAGKPPKDAWRVKFTDDLFDDEEETHTLTRDTYCNPTNGATAAAGSWSAQWPYYIHCIGGAEPFHGQWECEGRELTSCAMPNVWRCALCDPQPEHGLCAACCGGATAASSGSATSAASKKAATAQRHAASKEAEKAQKRDDRVEKWKQLLASLHVYKDRCSNLKMPYNM